MVTVADVGLEATADTHAILLSQDCDIVAAVEVEAEVELILARFVDTHNPTLLHARHPRTLHLPTSDGRHVHCDLRRRRHVRKECLPPAPPADLPSLDRRAVATLARWAGRRYFRDAFPEEFVRRLAAERQRLDRASKLPGAAYVSAIYVSLSTYDELPGTQDYRLLLCFACRRENYDHPARLAEAEKFAAAFLDGLRRCQGLRVEDESDVRATRDITLEDLESFRRFDYDARTIAGDGPDGVVDV
jgi:hypothetical protein